MTRLMLALSLVVALGACIRANEVRCIRNPVTMEWECHASGVQTVDGSLEAL